jgi:NADH-quinone oxidoreductase subunit C
MDIRTPVPTIYGDWTEKFSKTWASQIEGLKAALPGVVSEVLMPGTYPTDVPILFVEPSKVLDALAHLKNTAGCEYVFLSDITATDEESEPRFHVVYQLFSPKNGWRIRVKVRVNDGDAVPSATALWPAANWAEREVWDMFGIQFSGHPDLRRILMDQRWVGHPLRKDYPLRGYQLFPDPAPANEALLES